MGLWVWTFCPAGQGAPGGQGPHPSVHLPVLISPLSGTVLGCEGHLRSDPVCPFRFHSMWVFVLPGVCPLVSPNHPPVHPHLCERTGPHLCPCGCDPSECVSPVCVAAHGCDLQQLPTPANLADAHQDPPPGTTAWSPWIPSLSRM